MRKDAARRVAAIAFLALSGGLMVMAAGEELLRRPVGTTALALWVAWGVATAPLRQAGARSAYDRRQVLPRATGAILGSLAILVVGPWEYTHMSGPLPRDGALAWLGIGLLAVGAGVNVAAMWSLRGLYTVRLGVQPGHRVVTTGPYRFVRHPGYLGFFLALPGLGLALGSLAVLACALGYVPWILWRIREEEAMLVSEFGEDYRSYQRRTKRLLPFLF